MNQVIIDIHKFNALLAVFTAKEKEDGIFKQERAFYKGGIMALNQVLIDNRLAEIANERIPEESE